MDKDRTGQRMPRPSALFVLVFLGALLVVFGAAALPPMTHHSPQGLVLQTPATTPPPASASAPAPEDPEPGARPSEEAVSRIGQTIAAVLFAVVVLFVVGLVLSLRRRELDAAPQDSGLPEEIPSEARLRADVAATLARAEASLEAATGAPIRSRIIAAWAELERLAAARGLKRDRALAPTEQAGAMLAAFAVSTPALARLLALYERVRYDVGEPAWEPDGTQVRQAGADFARLAAEVGAADRSRGRTGADA